MFYGNYFRECSLFIINWMLFENKNSFIVDISQTLGARRLLSCEVYGYNFYLSFKRLHDKY